MSLNFPSKRGKDIQLVSTIYIEDSSVRLLCGEDSDFEGLRNACSDRVREMDLAASWEDILGFVQSDDTRGAHAFACPVYDSVLLCNWKPWFCRCVQEP